MNLKYCPKCKKLKTISHYYKHCYGLSFYFSREEDEC